MERLKAPWVVIGIALSLLAVPVVAEAAADARTMERTYVAGLGGPAAYFCSGGSTVDAFGAGGVCFPTEDGETDVTLTIDDAVRNDPATPLQADVCAAYTVSDVGGPGGGPAGTGTETLAHGHFQGSVDVPLPADADHVSVVVGDGPEPGVTGQSLTDCPDTHGTVGTVVAAFS